MFVKRFLYVYGVETTHLSVVDANGAADHLWDNNHVTQVGLYDGGLLVWWSLLLGLAQLLDETHRLALETALEPAAGTGMDELVVPHPTKLSPSSNIRLV